MSFLDNSLDPVVAQALMALNVNPDHVRQHGVINAVESALIEMGGDLEDYEVTHYVMPHVIARQAVLPAMRVITTQRHRHWHPYIITKGNVSVYNEKDGTVKHITAVDAIGGHFCSITEPETRRFIFVREETIWTTFHPCEHGDVNRMYQENIIPNNNPLITPYAS